MSKIPPNNKLDLAEKAFHIRFCPFHNELADLVSARELGGFSWFLLWEQAPQPEWSIFEILTTRFKKKD
jgi:hypothetical protein